MPSYSTIYKCHRCGATSYQPVIGRDAHGALMPTGQFRCTGCRATFSDLREWWGHGGAGHGPYFPATPSMTSTQISQQEQAS
jgi:DNA-directed RNA polymerase subunit RPC12/RpoP